MWKAHLDHVILKAKSSLMVMRHLIEYEWGLKPRVTLWINTAIVRPQLMYGFLIWWLNLAHATADSKLGTALMHAGHQSFY